METAVFENFGSTGRFIFCIEKQLQENRNAPLSAEGLKLGKELLQRLNGFPMNEQDRHEIERLFLELINTIFGDGVIFGTHAAIAAFTEIH